MNTPPIEKDKPPPSQPQSDSQQQQQPSLGKSLPITPKPAQPSHPSGSGINTPSKILPTNKQQPPPAPPLKQQPLPHPHPKQQPMKPVLHPQGNNKQTPQPIKPRPAMHPIAPKYHKIQPAIAPKPIASANNKNASSQPSKFNPIPTGKLSLSMNSSTLAKNATNNGKDCSSLNTSRKWVLPPRPRPGRKPTHEAGATPENEKKTKGNGNTVTKKKPKCKKEPVPTVTPDLLSTPSPSTTGTPTSSKSLSSTPSDNKKSSSVSSSSATPAIPENASTSDQQLPDIPIPTIDVDPKTQLLEMKMSYLSKLKEQELIRNYIEILTNQIKELGFIQNGVITFDALKSNMKYNKIPSTVTSTSSTNARYDQLEAINNLNDLNKYLNYLTKSSNIINSVKKKSVIEGPDGDSIDHQIDHYLEIRNKFKSVKKMDVLNFKNFNQLGIPVQANTPSPTIENSPANGDIFKNNDITSIFSGTTFQDDMNADPDKFVPDLLKPIKASNLFSDLQQQHSQAAQLQLQPSQDTDLQIQTETIEESISSTSILSNSSIPPTSTTGNIGGGDSLNKFLDDDYDNIDGFFMDEHDFLNRLVLNDNVNMDQDQEQDVFGSVEIHGSSSSNNNNNTTTTNNNDNANEKNNGNGNDMMIKKKKLKLNCGFCTNDTPCLCFDTLSPDK